MAYQFTDHQQVDPLTSNVSTTNSYHDLGLSNSVAYEYIRPKSYGVASKPRSDDKVDKIYADFEGATASWNKVPDPDGGVGATKEVDYCPATKYRTVTTVTKLSNVGWPNNDPYTKTSISTQILVNGEWEIDPTMPELDENGEPVLDDNGDPQSVPNEDVISGTKVTVSFGNVTSNTPIDVRTPTSKKTGYVKVGTATDYATPPVTHDVTTTSSTTTTLSNPCTMSYLLGNPEVDDSQSSQLDFYSLHRSRSGKVLEYYSAEGTLTLDKGDQLERRTDGNGSALRNTFSPFEPPIMWMVMKETTSDLISDGRSLHKDDVPPPIYTSTRALTNPISYPWINDRGSFASSESVELGWSKNTSSDLVARYFDPIFIDPVPDGEVSVGTVKTMLRNFTAYKIRARIKLFRDNYWFGGEGYDDFVDVQLDIGESKEDDLTPPAIPDGEQGNSIWVELGDIEYLTTDEEGADVWVKSEEVIDYGGGYTDTRVIIPEDLHLLWKETGAGRKGEGFATTESTEGRSFTTEAADGSCDVDNSFSLSRVEKITDYNDHGAYIGIGYLGGSVVEDVDGLLERSGSVTGGGYDHTKTKNFTAISEDGKLLESIDYVLMYDGDTITADAANGKSHSFNDVVVGYVHHGMRINDPTL